MKQVKLSVPALDLKRPILILTYNGIDDVAAILSSLRVANAEGLCKLVRRDRLVYRQLANVAFYVAVFDDSLWDRLRWRPNRISNTLRSDRWSMLSYLVINWHVPWAALFLDVARLEVRSLRHATMLREEVQMAIVNVLTLNEICRMLRCGHQVTRVTSNATSCGALVEHALLGLIIPEL